jgi:hypothetical protein
MSSRRTTRGRSGGAERRVIGRGREIENVAVVIDKKPGKTAGRVEVEGAGLRRKVLLVLLCYK